MMMSYWRRCGVAVRKVAVTLPEELFQMVERARKIEHRTRSEVVQEALRSHFGGPVYVPTEEELRMIDEAVAEFDRDPEAARSWAQVREELQAGP
jgi:hypothetical protein